MTSNLDQLLEPLSKAADHLHLKLMAIPFMFETKYKHKFKTRKT